MVVVVVVVQNRAIQSSCFTLTLTTVDHLKVAFLFVVRILNRQEKVLRKHERLVGGIFDGGRQNHFATTCPLKKAPISTTIFITTNQGANFAKSRSELVIELWPKLAHDPHSLQLILDPRLHSFVPWQMQLPSLTLTQMNELSSCFFTIPPPKEVSETHLLT